MQFFLILFFLLASVCQAAESGIVNQELDEVVVTASRVEEKVKETPATTNVVSQHELENIKFRNPSEFLNRLPGIYTHDFGGESELTSIRVPTHFVNGYTMVLVDGVPTTSYGSGSSGQITDMNDRDIERIEVVKGPSSALYGSNAIGGIINIITKDPSPEPEMNFWAEYGEYEQYTGGVSASGSGQKVSYDLDVNYKNSEGWRDHSAIEKKVGTAKFQFVPTESSLLGVKFELLSTDNESAGSLDEAAFIEDWQHSYYAGSIAKTTMDKYVGTITYDYFLQNGEFRTVLNVRKIDHTTLPHYNIRQLTYGPYPRPYIGYYNDIQGLDTNLQMLYSRDMAFWRSKLIIGIDAEYGGTETDQDELEVEIDDTDPILYTYTSYTVTGDSKWLDVTTKTAAPYLQIAASPVERLRITAGGRYDSVTYEVDDKLNSGMSGDKDFSKFSPKVGLTYEISRNLNTYASYSEGFVVPTTSQLFTSSNSNEELDPEKAKNYEIGFRSMFLDRKIDLDIAAYYMEIEDKIAQTDRRSKYYNAAETSMKGIETVLVFRPVDMLSLTCAYTYARNKWETYIITTGDYSGNTQPRSPEHHFNIRLALMPFEGFEAELEVDKISSQYGDDANEVSYSRPTLVNLRTSYDWNDWSFWAHVTNLTDEKYATYLSGEEGDMGYYSGKPRTFFAGLSYRWSM
jgi:TonB-dependent siderophore receptor